MDCHELLDILNRGEDSAHQFKENFTSIDNLAVEISAFANTDGGKIIIGVSDRGKVIGLSPEDIHRLNQWTSNATTSKIDKSINEKLTLAGLLLFGKNPERLRPQFVIKATYFAGNDVSVRDFIDKQDIHGKLIEQFKEGKAFIYRGKHQIRRSRGAQSDHPFLPGKRHGVQLYRPRQRHSTRHQSVPSRQS